MVVRSLRQLERNVSASFGYVKKDILMVNDAISNVHDKMQHLSLNQALLLEKIEKLQNTLDKKNSSKNTSSSKKKETLEFYNVKTKSKFKSSEYKLVTRSGRRFAVAKDKDGTECYRIMGAVKKKKKAKKTSKKKTKTTSKKAKKKAQKKKVSKKKTTKKKTVSKTPKKVITETETVLYE